MNRGEIAWMGSGTRSAPSPRTTPRKPARRLTTGKGLRVEPVALRDKVRSARFVRRWQEDQSVRREEATDQKSRYAKVMQPGVQPREKSRLRDLNPGPRLYEGYNHRFLLVLVIRRHFWSSFDAIRQILVCKAFTSYNSVSTRSGSLDAHRLS